MDISPQVLINKKKFGKYNLKNQLDELTFGRKKFLIKREKGSNYEELAGLNDLDSNILNTKNISSASLRLEIQLDNTEKRLKKINKELENNKKLSFTGFNSNKKLYITKKRLEKEFNFYRKQYRDQGFFYNVTDCLISAKNLVFKGAGLLKDEIKNNIFVRTALNKVELHKAKNKVAIALLLNKKLSNEMAKPLNKNPQEIEAILHKANKLL